MARSARDAKLETRTARLKLKPGVRYWKTIGKGVAMGYRRTVAGFGTWSVRVLQRDGKYVLRAVGTADDYQDANNADVFDFYQAQGAARKVFEEAQRRGAPSRKDVTVEDATERYLVWFRQQRKGVPMAESAIRAHILPALRDRKLSDLSATELRSWLERLASKPARLRTGKRAQKMNVRPAAATADAKRARRATANRVFSVLRAVLNRAFEDGLVADDSEWRKVKPFKKTDEARIRFLTGDEGIRLVNSCPADLRKLVRAALLTGARWGELTTLKVADVNLSTGHIYVAESKSDRSRHVPLNPEGIGHFRSLLVGKVGSDFVLSRKDGKPWGHNHHVRALKAACIAAKVKPAVSFHELRHTYASHLAQVGVDLLTISKLLGHSDTRITSRHYAHLADKSLAAAVNRLPSFNHPRNPKVRAVA